MHEREWLAERFEAHRPRLRSVAYRMLGSTSEADDAVQESWILLNRSNASEIDNLQAWLVTVVGRVSLNMLRSRKTRREEPLEKQPDPVDDVSPEHEALMADSVGLAMLVILETLTPAERLAFVLHDMFSVPFDEIARILDRSPEAVRQLASRGRRRVRGAEATPEPDPTAQRAVVEAFLAAGRDGDFDALIAVLDPNIVVRQDVGITVQGALNVARRARSASQIGLTAELVRVNGRIGWRSWRDGEVFAIAAITVRDGRITSMDIVHEPANLASVEVTPVDS